MPKVTWLRVYNWIISGIGQGHGRDYKPAMAVRRWNPSKISVQVAGGVPPYFRRGAYFSKNEWQVGQGLAWAGANTREQFPMWPWEHPHPLTGLDTDLDLTLSLSSGMQSICNEMGIDHGVFIGTNIPYIWTIDYSIWAKLPSGQYHAGFVSVKPVEDERFQKPDPTDRALEKLEAERRYSASLGMHYQVTGAAEFPGELLTQLEWLRGTAVLPENDPRNYFLQGFLDHFIGDAQICPPAEWMHWLQVELGATYEQAVFICHHVIWHQYVDFDLTREINFSRVPQPGGRALKKRIQEYFLGVAL
ncbi:MAG: TnsA endonuclease N-terminal domain-containing protein [Candidatus Thiodiazotropha sp. (ex. Lucinisca nassula)]|nr:TnsA endonuclease N-terminal domain-containing protein [Candidatus Thiodiazotropha sp. (ex. Lucinisca nassula)]MBW9275046.1 TnsA endonuclease N-terminal domain-containing protein [Candidatus Thiodiazotropha sp. (ex. Lucinisca nassula)]